MRGIDHLRNSMKREAVASRSHLENGVYKGIVTVLDIDSQTAKVMLQPDEIETGYLRIKTAWAGPNWGLFAPPPVGTEVEVSFEDGNINSGTITGAHHNDIDSPLPTPGGELWLVHNSGTSLKLFNSSEVTIRHKSGTELQLDADGQAKLLHNLGQLVSLLNDKTLNLTHPDGGYVKLLPGGFVSIGNTDGKAGFLLLGDTGALQRLIKESFQALFNAHTHTAQGDHAQTTPPNQQMGDEHLTSQAKAS